MADLHQVQVQLILAMQAEYERARKIITPQLEAQGVAPDLIQLTVAQNAIRTALEATLEAMLPYDQSTLANLAVSLASYCISALPAQNQMDAVAVVIEKLPEAHVWRVQHGTRLSTTWMEPDGVERPNFADDEPLGHQS